MSTRSLPPLRLLAAAVLRGVRTGRAFGRVETQGGARSADSVAVRVKPLFASVLGMGHEHSCPLSARGAAYCWGDNQYGQLGIGPTPDTGLPIRAPGAP